MWKCEVDFSKIFSNHIRSRRRDPNFWLIVSIHRGQEQ